MSAFDASYYRRDLALVHHLGFGFHADLCAPGILKLLEPVRARGGLVVELGCGSGLLTRHLTEAGHRVLATDASAAMLDLAREHAPGAEDVRQLVLPDDPIPPADAVVSVGHVLSYLPDEASVDRALVAAAEALRPGGVLAIDICDREWGAARQDAPNLGRVADDWAIVTSFRCRRPTASFDKWRSLSVTTTARGGATTSATTTFSSTPLASQPCWPSTGSRRGSRPRSAARSCPPAFAQS